MDSQGGAREESRLVLGLGAGVERVSLLPFHKFGEHKYPAMGRACSSQGVPLISLERMQAFQKLIESFGIKVDVGR